MTRITMPEGNPLRYAYDARGNREDGRAVAKAGSGLHPRPGAISCLPAPGERPMAFDRQLPSLEDGPDCPGRNPLTREEADMATCTAPGHPGCTITCPNGCMALYVEPNGPCRTRCSGGGRLEIEEGESFSIQISELPADDLAEALGDAAELLGGLKESGRTISYSGRHGSLRELAEALARQG